MLFVDSLAVIGIATISLGTIQETDGAQERTFWLRNAGDESVVLLQGYTSCVCTTIVFDKDANISPGDSTAVTLHFNPRGKGGDFEEVGTLLYGSEMRKKQGKKPHHIQFALTGRCITGEETLMRQFPVHINDNLRLSTDRFDLGVMRVGETKERNVVVLHKNKNNSQERIPIHFTVDADKKKGIQHIAYPIIVDGTEVSILLDVLIK
ncbi:DUF1573 domain-containing protein [Prevotella koreensis]|uniref:DUF1573 domain-containing protein n=1 Tax=Prevotella koreensis TaxID=2490854 RepID=A0A3S0RBM6_9BACT|nr:DUF1573 domain-containing protein [Prevotella koreensis]RUL60138.1 DUF1573 domain-containing protein [Prevotella koreensis]